jgi:hypothetical protein
LTFRIGFGIGRIFKSIQEGKWHERLATMMQRRTLTLLALVMAIRYVFSFQSASFKNGQSPRSELCSAVSSVPSKDDGDNKENKAMAFLKKIGKVGGSASRDFRFAIGVDEGASGKSLDQSATVSIKAMAVLRTLSSERSRSLFGSDPMLRFAARA